MNWVCFNGNFIEDGKPVFLPANRSYRYGDGLFETMRLSDARIALKEFHFQRLFEGLALLAYEIPPTFNHGRLEEEVLQLCVKNSCTERARIRLSVSRGNGTLSESGGPLQYLIECGPLPEPGFNEKGLHIGIYPLARKSTDPFSNLKSANFLPYVMASRYATEHALDDCLVLNTSGNIADSTIANLFTIKNGAVLTPFLSEGCVDGVMRKYLLQRLSAAGYPVEETMIHPMDLEDVDEVFLSNAIRGIQWVARIGKKTYSNKTAAAIYQQLFKTIRS